MTVSEDVDLRTKMSLMLQLICFRFTNVLHLHDCSFTEHSCIDLSERF